MTSCRDEQARQEVAGGHLDRVIRRECQLGKQVGQAGKVDRR